MMLTDTLSHVSAQKVSLVDTLTLNSPTCQPTGQLIRRDTYALPHLGQALVVQDWLLSPTPVPPQKPAQARPMKAGLRGWRGGIGWGPVCAGVWGTFQ